MLIITTCISSWDGGGNAFFFFSRSGLNKRVPLHHMWHVTLFCYGWEGYTKHTRRLLGQKRNSGWQWCWRPFLPFPCSPPFCCFSSLLPFITALTVMQTTVYAWCWQKFSAGEKDHPDEVHPCHKRGRKNSCPSLVLLTQRFISQVSYCIHQR